MSIATNHQPRVAIVLVNWNNWRDTVECLDSLLAQAYPDFHIYVVDNESGDQSVEHIAAWCEAPRRDSAWRTHEGVDRVTANVIVEAVPYRIADAAIAPLPPALPECRLTLVRSGGNLGFAGGCNVGMRAAALDAHFFWLVNTDTVVHRDALSALVRRALGDPKIGMVGSMLRYYAQPDRIQALAGGRMNPDNAAMEHIGENMRPADVIDVAAVERELAYIMGASMLVSADFVQEVGPMQEDYFLYYEEADWAMRGRGKFTLGFAADSHIYHKAGGSSGKVMPLFSLRHFYRNRVRFVGRFHPQCLPGAKRVLRLELALYLLKGRFAKARIVADALRDARLLTSREARARSGFAKIATPDSEP